MLRVTRTEDVDMVVGVGGTSDCGEWVGLEVEDREADCNGLERSRCLILRAVVLGSNVFSLAFVCVRIHALLSRARSASIAPIVVVAGA